MERPIFVHVRDLCNKPREDSHMLKIALAVSAAATLFTAAPLLTTAKAEGVKG